jgi:hypothetical protein
VAELREVERARIVAGVTEVHATLLSRGGYHEEAKRMHERAMALNPSCVVPDDATSVPGYRPGSSICNYPAMRAKIQYPSHDSAHDAARWDVEQMRQRALKLDPSHGADLHQYMMVLFDHLLLDRAGARQHRRRMRADPECLPRVEDYAVTLAGECENPGATCLIYRQVLDYRTGAGDEPHVDRWGDIYDQTWTSWLSCRRWVSLPQPSGLSLCA